MCEAGCPLPPSEPAAQGAGHRGLVAPGGPDEERTHDVARDATGDRCCCFVFVVTRCHGTRAGEVLAAAPEV